MGTQEMTEETLDGSQDQDSENNNTHATDKDSQSQSLSPDAAQHGGNAPAKGSLCVPQLPGRVDDDSPPPKKKKVQVRRAGMTEYCGKVSPRIKTPRKAARNNGDYVCIICQSRFTRFATVNFHFPGCVEKYGNPNGNHWNDHPSCAGKGFRPNRVRDSPATFAVHSDEEEEEQQEEDRVHVPFQYDPRTIASDILRVLGEHPTLPPLNAHLMERDPTFSFSAPPNLRDQHQQKLSNGEAGTLGVEKKLIAEEWRVLRESEEAQGKNTKAQSDAMKPPRSNQTSFRQTPSGNSAPDQSTQASQLGPLPQGWRKRTSRAGHVYFVNFRTSVMTFDDPRTSPQPRPFSRLGTLPSGWAMCVCGTLDNPRVYFVDHNTRRNTWEDPRGPPP